MQKILFLGMLALGGCASAPPKLLSVELHDLTRLARADLVFLEQQRKSGDVTLPSGGQAVCQARACDIQWVRARLPIMDGDRPVAVYENVTGKIGLSHQSMGDLLALMNSAKQLGREVSYHEEEGGVTCSAEDCGVDLKIWVDPETPIVPRVETGAARVQSLVHGAITVGARR